jgi:hypothetical protein
MMSLASELASICKDLRLLGDKSLTNQAITAYAALTDVENPRPDLSYTYVLRKLRKGDDKRRLKFQKAFKAAFDKALYSDVDEPAAIALTVAIKAIDYDDEDEDAR